MEEKYFDIAKGKLIIVEWGNLERDYDSSEKNAILTTNVGFFVTQDEENIALGNMMKEERESVEFYNLILIPKALIKKIKEQKVGV
jgi:hypothetical protein